MQVPLTMSDNDLPDSEITMVYLIQMIQTSTKQRNIEIKTIRHIQLRSVRISTMHERFHMVFKISKVCHQKVLYSSTGIILDIAQLLLAWGSFYYPKNPIFNETIKCGNTEHYVNYCVSQTRTNRCPSYAVTLSTNDL